MKRTPEIREASASRASAGRGVVICCCRHRPAPGEVIYRAFGWSTNAIGHRWGIHIRVEHRPRDGQCAHVPTQGYGDIDASIGRDREAGLLVTEVT